MQFKNELSRSKLSEVRALGYWQTHRHMRPKHYSLLLHSGSTYTIQSYTVDKTIKQKHHPRKNLTEVHKHEHNA